MRLERTIWGRSRESFPIVLKTRSCSLLTVDNRSSPSAAIVALLVLSKQSSRDAELGRVNHRHAEEQ